MHGCDIASIILTLSFHFIFMLMFVGSFTQGISPSDTPGDLICQVYNVIHECPFKAFLVDGMLTMLNKPGVIS